MKLNFWRPLAIFLLLALPLAAWSQGLPMVNVTGGKGGTQYSLTLQLLALSGHTGADLAILDVQSGVLFAGDLVFYQRALTTPGTPSLATWLADLDQLQQLTWKQIVPGHGPLASDAAPFVQMRDYLGWLDGVMRSGAEQGAEMNELIRTAIPERFAGVSLSRYELIRSVSHLYPRYERQRLQRIDGM